jgi:hypothetical protein
MSYNHEKKPKLRSNNKRFLSAIFEILALESFSVSHLPVLCSLEDTDFKQESLGGSRNAE